MITSISATTQVIVTTEEVIMATMSPTTKGILVTNQLVSATEKNI